MKTRQNIDVDVFYDNNTKSLYVLIEEENAKCTVKDIMEIMQDLIKQGLGDYHTKAIRTTSKEDTQKTNKKIILTNGTKFWGVE